MVRISSSKIMAIEYETSIPLLNLSPNSSGVESSCRNGVCTTCAGKVSYILLSNI